MQRADFYFLVTTLTAPFVVITAFQPDYPLAVLQAAYLVSHIFWPAFLALIVTAIFLTPPGRDKKYHLLFGGWLLLTYVVYGYLEGDLNRRMVTDGFNPLLQYPSESMLLLLGALGLIALLDLVQVVKSAKAGSGDDKTQAYTGGAGFTFIFSNLFLAAMLAGIMGVFLWLPSCEDQPWPRRTILRHDVSLCRLAGCHEYVEHEGADCERGSRTPACQPVYKCSN